MELPFEVKLKQKPSGKENFETKWRMKIYNWLKVYKVLVLYQY